MCQKRIDYYTDQLKSLKIILCAIAELIDHIIEENEKESNLMRADIEEKMKGIESRADLVSTILREMKNG